ncbi:MAG TPA: radical SAM peptide maturase [Bacteroidales bacterium]
MEATVFFNTPQHTYLYDASNKAFLYAHPLWKEFKALEDQGVKPEEWEERISNSLPHFYEQYRADLPYYKNKYFYLKEQGFFQKLPEERTIAELRSKQVDYALDDIHQIVFEVTNRCNLSCKYCGYGELYSNYNVREGVDLSIANGKKVLDYFIARWKLHPPRSYKRELFVSFYGGEPLLNMPFIKEMVAYVELHFPKEINYQFSMTSNCVLLQKNVDFLAEKKFHLLISLDGDEQAQSYRVNHAGVNSFSTIIPQIKALKENYPDYFRELVQFNAVLHNRNTAESVLEFVKAEFDKAPRISELNDSGINPDKIEEFYQTFQNISVSLEKAKHRERTEQAYFIELPKVRALGIFTTRYTDNYLRMYDEFFLSNNFTKLFSTGTCVPFSKKIFITSIGKIFPCEQIGEEIPLGSVDETNGLQIDRESVVAFYNAFLSKIAGLCNRCYRLSSCSSCMFYFKDIHNPVCDDFLNKSGFEEYLADYMQILENEPHLQARIREEVTFS